MKNLNKIFDVSNVKNSEEFFDKFTNTLKENITTWDYFVNWGKVFEQTKEIELELNILNYLIGKSKESIKDELKKLLEKYPKVAEAIPIISCLQG